MWSPSISTAALAIVAAVALCLPAPLAHAQKARPGTVHVVELSGLSATDFAWLRSRDFDIDPCSMPGVRVYATADELAELAKRGIQHRVVEVQPNWPVYADEVKALGQYHSHTTMTERLEDTAEAYPQITRLVNLGNSVQGRALWTLLITDNPDVEEDEPEFKYVSTMHGDEVMGTEMCLYFIDTLVSQYGNSSAEGQRVTQLVDNTAIWIVPMMNPDGHTAGTRYNTNGIDLNRNFPSLIRDGADGNIYDGDPLDDTGRQPETRHVMQWTAANSFVLSANMHGGALVVNYPYDEDFGVSSGQYAACPDDALFVDISKRYAQNNPPMWASTAFPMGITNGAAWYVAQGGMQDWHYRYVSCKDVTLELSNTKRPHPTTITSYWNNNKESMFQYLEAVHLGIRGVVTDAATGDPVYARITIDGNAQAVYTDPDVGDYHRLLLPGIYTLRASAPGLPEAVIPGITVGDGAATRVDIALGAVVVEGEAEGEGAPEGEGAAEGEGAPEGEAELRHTLLLDTGGTGTGGVSFNPMQETFAPGQSVLLIATPGPGSRFDRWEGPDAAALQPDAQSAAALLLMDGDKALTAIFEPDAGEGEGAPEGETGPAFSSADQDQNHRFSLGELLRLIQLYNSPGFGCLAGSEDGYAPGAADQACPAHTSDYAPRDWAIGLSELLRLIQLYNAGGYRACGGSEDGFCPGL